MFYENIGVPVRSSTKYLAIFGLVLFLVGMGYSVYLYRKASTPPPVPERATRSGPSESTTQRAGDECMKKEPCTPFLEANGLTEKVRMKEGRSLCFDDSFFENLPRLGYKTSYQGTAEDPGCTTVSCKMDAFWFEPEAGIRVPKYWYVPEGSPRC